MTKILAHEATIFVAKGCPGWEYGRVAVVLPNRKSGWIPEARLDEFLRDHPGAEVVR